MYYVYVLQAKDGERYTGCTKDLRKRFDMHNSGKVESTQMRRPLKLIFYEAFLDKHDAFTREHFLKTGWGRNQLRKLLSNFEKLGG